MCTFNKKHYEFHLFPPKQDEPVPVSPKSENPQEDQEDGEETSADTE